jgi:photosystem II stability/assembly factor-like uncharacterized protein
MTMQTIKGQRKALASSISLAVCVLVSGGFVVGNADAQWQIAEPAPTTADLRGIDYVGNGVAWASGTEGTVLRTEDSGYLWQRCSVPQGAEHLDFRGVQAFDANTAIVMSSGKGPLSRLYKTTDGCQTWKPVLDNPYAPEGFFDALLFIDAGHGILFGDPTGLSTNTPVEYANDFRIRVTDDGGATWGPVSAPDGKSAGMGLHAIEGESAFAASNSAIAVRDGWFWFGTSAARVASRRLWTGSSQDSAEREFLFRSTYCAGALDPISKECGQPWTDFRTSTAPVLHAGPSSGIFSIFFRSAAQGVVVGGDYRQPADHAGIAAYSNDGGLHWIASRGQPNGYRSAVSYDPATKTWITVGPNGTDISTDDGRNWWALRPDAARGDAPDADQHWNALSLPFVVGPHGRIGKLRADALKTAPSAK